MNQSEWHDIGVEVARWWPDAAGLTPAVLDAWGRQLAGRSAEYVAGAFLALRAAAKPFPSLGELEVLIRQEERRERLSVAKLPEPRPPRSDWAARQAAIPPTRWAQVKGWVAAECPSLVQAARGDSAGMVGAGAAKAVLLRASVVLAEDQTVQSQEAVARRMLTVGP